MRVPPLAALAAFAWLAGCVNVTEFRALEQEVARLKGAGSAPPERVNARLAELGAQVAELQEEIGRLRGELEETRHAAEQAREQVRALRESAAAPGAPSSAGAGPGGASTGVASAGAVSSELAAEVRSYEDAFRLYRQSEYRGAIDRFRAFLQTYPSSDYADNALFWLGECHFKLGDHEQAVLAFDDVVKRYPEGNKVPDALYRQGIALLEIGEKTGEQSKYRPAARQIFERVVADYPDSERVGETRRQLEKLSP